MKHQNYARIKVLILITLLTVANRLYYGDPTYWEIKTKGDCMHYGPFFRSMSYPNSNKAALNCIAEFNN